MKQYLKVNGTQENISNLEVNVDTVYIRSNINRIETEDFTGWEYDEIQYALNEYQQLIGDKTTNLTDDINEVANIVVLSLDDLIIIADLLNYALDEIKLLKGEMNK